MSQVTQGPNPNQLQQVNPVLLANDLYINITEQLNLLRKVILEMAVQLDQIKRPATNDKLLEFDAQRRAAN